MEVAKAGGAGTTAEQKKLEYLKLLYGKEGFIISCKTLVRLYGVVKTEEGGEGKWEKTDSGILSLISLQQTLSLVFTSLKTGEITQEFEIKRSINSFHSTTPSYTTHTPNFHSFVSSTVENTATIIVGVNFLNTRAADKFMKIVNELTNSGTQLSLNEKNSPETKGGRIRSDGKDNEPVDFASPGERDGVSDSVSDNSATMFSGSSLKIPAPPEHDDSEESLLADISTFAVHVTGKGEVDADDGKEEATGGVVAADCAGIPELRRKRDGKVVEKAVKLLHAGYIHMLPMIQAKYGIQRTASISSSGDLEGLDGVEGVNEWDGPVIIHNCDRQ